MLARTSHTSELDAARRSADAAAARAAHRLDVRLRRACGTALALVADVTGADLDVARVNAALEAAGRADLLPTASARMRSVVPVGLTNVLWVTLRVNPREARRG